MSAFRLSDLKGFDAELWEANLSTIKRAWPTASRIERRALIIAARQLFLALSARYYWDGKQWSRFTEAA